jgi:methionyl-tRNA formyltransferase
MNIVFMGTPEFAVPCLQALIEANYQVVGVVTQPDRPKGRKRELTPPPVKVIANDFAIPVYQPESLRTEGALAPIFAWQPDIIVTVAYGQILPESLLNFPKHRCINVHASLLPKYRGGAPIQHAIMNGEQQTGVTIMYMEKGLDTGDMLANVVVPILAEDDNGSMHMKLSEAGANLLIETLPALLAGQLSAVPQEHHKSSFARNITREDERIDWQRPAEQLYNQVRGLHPWPIAHTHVNDEVFKIWKCRWSKDHLDSAAPGTLVRLESDGMFVQTGDGTLILEVIQPAGKKALSVSDYIRGNHLTVGTIFQGSNER